MPANSTQQRTEPLPNPHRMLTAHRRDHQGSAARGTSVPGSIHREIKDGRLHGLSVQTPVGEVRRRNLLSEHGFSEEQIAVAEHLRLGYSWRDARLARHIDDRKPNSEETDKSGAQPL